MNKIFKIIKREKNIIYIKGVGKRNVYFEFRDKNNIGKEFIVIKKKIIFLEELETKGDE